ncbi:tripartite tricarboxylate transporter permease [Leptolyngbya sp. 15MV]|nr:tripartite tricarboxylate transporter permease [Leptolyngbya sp. 15MV]
MEGFLGGLAVLLDPYVMLMVLLGTVLGIFVGALPGISAIYCAANFGGSITAIMVNAPGDPSASATALEGYKMAEKGQAGLALGMSAVSSAIGGIFSIVVLIVAAPMLARAAYSFGPPEYFALALFGLSMCAAIGGDSAVKNLIAAALGLLIATVGMDLTTGVERYAFGLYELSDGIGFVPVLIGLFAVGEMLDQAARRVGRAKIIHLDAARVPGWAEFRKCNRSIWIGSGLGTFIGALPALGATTAALIGYNETKRWSKHQDEFGKGSIEGVAGPEAANNAAVGGSMVPTLALGIPGSATPAIILAGLIVQGVRPGPHLPPRMAASGPGDVDQVGDHRAGGRPVARARALEQQAAGEIAFGHHGVGRAGDMGERMPLGHQARPDPLEQVQRTVAPFTVGHADQPHDVAQPVGLGDVGGAHAGNALALDRREIDSRAERDRGEDRELVRGVGALDVESGVGLGVSEPLRRRQRVAEVSPARLHRREDVVGGAVEHAVDALDGVGGGAFAQALDHRNAARDRCLELERRARRLGRLGQCEPVVRDHRLVGGDEALARADRPPRQRQRRAIGPADQLDHHVDVFARGQRGHVVDPVEPGDVDAAVAVAAARADSGDLDPAPGPRGHERGIGVEQPDDTGPDRAEPGERDAQRFRHCGTGRRAGVS